MIVQQAAPAASRSSPDDNPRDLSTRHRNPTVQRMPAIDRPAWIAFDAVGTLIFADPPVHLAYYRIGRKYGSGARPEEVLHRFRSAYARHSCPDAAGPDGAPAGGGERAERNFWRRIVADVLPDVSDADACFEELFEHFATPHAWQIFADVDATLTEARQRGYRLALASNFDSRLHGICDALPGLGLIERRVISSEIGCRKPHPEFFRALLDRCGGAADELLYIGDDFEHDVQGARRAGIRAVHLDRSGASGRECRAGDAPVIHSLYELWPLLAGQERRADSAAL